MPGRRLRENLRHYSRCLNGEYVYVGDRVASPLTEKERKAAQRRLALLSFGTVGCVLAAGSIPAPGMQQGPLVIPFYLGEVCAAVRLAWAAVCLGREDWKGIRGYRFTGTAEVLAPAGGFAAGFAAAAGAGGALHLCRHGLENVSAPYAALFFFFQAAAAALALRTRKAARALPWVKTGGSPDTAGGKGPSGGAA